MYAARFNQSFSIEHCTLFSLCVFVQLTCKSNRRISGILIELRRILSKQKKKHFFCYKIFIDLTCNNDVKPAVAVILLHLHPNLMALRCLAMIRPMLDRAYIRDHNLLVVILGHHRQSHFDSVV